MKSGSTMCERAGNVRWSHAPVFATGARTACRRRATRPTGIVSRSSASPTGRAACGWRARGWWSSGARDTGLWRCSGVVAGRRLDLVQHRAKRQVRIGQDRLRRRRATGPDCAREHETLSPRAMVAARRLDRMDQRQGPRARVARRRRTELLNGDPGWQSYGFSKGFRTRSMESAWTKRTAW